MANLTGPVQAFDNNTSAVDSSATQTPGSRARDTAGNEYIYLKGVGSTAAGSWVNINLTAKTTKLLSASDVGSVGIAMAAIVADKYGWYQVFGSNTIASTDTVAANKQLYIDGTAGRADDAVVAHDLIVGATSRTADSSNVATVELNYPYTTGVIL